MIGKQILHYKIIEKLGEGGMGVVYKAEDTKLDRLVAMKFLPLYASADSENKNRFIREAKAAASLNDQNICTVYEINEVEGQSFIVMEYIEGETLREKIQMEGKLNVDEALKITLQLSAGLSAAHKKGIIHRDIKSSNIIITPGGVCKIMDFGLAKSEEFSNITKSGSSVGTVAYMSPEQCRGEGVDSRTDIWSLGIVLYEMITGKVPYTGQSFQSIMYKIVKPEAIKMPEIEIGDYKETELILKNALSKDKKKRYKNIKEMESDLRSIFSNSNNTLIKGTEKIFISQVKQNPLIRFIKGIIFRFKMKYAISFILSLIILIPILFFIFKTPAISFEKRDWILISDVINNTDEDVFNNSLDLALTVSIQQSKYVNIFPRKRSYDTLKRMRKKNVKRIDEKIGCEIAVRENIKMLIVTEIIKIGMKYSFIAKIIEPETHNILFTGKVMAANKDKVLEALDELTESIRYNLGESIKSIKKNNIPLAHSTTSSLEALKLFSDGSYNWDKGEYKLAAELYKKAIDKDPDFAAAHVSYGGHLYYRNKRLEAEKHFKKAESLMDKLTEWERLFLPALIDGWKHNFDSAIFRYKLFLAKYPDYSPGWYNMANHYSRKRMYKLALECYDKSIKLNPNSPNSYSNRAICLQDLKDFDGAIISYKKAFKIDKNFRTNYYINQKYGFALIHIGKFKEAEETFKLMLNGRNAVSGFRSLALLDMYRGRYQSAVKYLKEAINISIAKKYYLSEGRDRMYLITVYSNIGDFESLKKEINTVGKLWENKKIAPNWLVKYGKHCVRSGNLKKSKEIIDIILKTKFPVNNIGKGIIKLYQGEVESAMGNYQKALELMEQGINLTLKNHTASIEPLAYLYYKNSEYLKAIETYKKINKTGSLGSESQDYWINSHYFIGKCYEKLNDPDKAVKSYKKFLSILSEADGEYPKIIEAGKRIAELSKKVIK